MSMSDTLADLYTRIRNANSAKKDTVDIPASNLKKKVVSILKDEGFVENYKVLEDNKQGMIRVKLKYGSKKSGAITNIKQISKPGLRIYAVAGDMPKVLGGLGIAIITTSKGVLTDKECRREKIGGEVLCYVW